MFEDLLIPYQDFKLVMNFNKFEAWKNVDDDFRINRGFIYQNQKAKWDISFEYSSPIYHLMKNVFNDKGLFLDHQGILVDSDYKHVLFPSHIQALKFLKESLPAILKDGKKECVVNFSLQKHTQTGYNILTHPKFNKPWHSLVDIVGRTQEWVLISYLEENIYKRTGVIVPEIFKTRQEAVIFLYNCLAKDLNLFFDMKKYQLFKQHNLIPPKNWWITFLKPEVDFEQIFK